MLPKDPSFQANRRLGAVQLWRIVQKSDSLQVDTSLNWCFVESAFWRAAASQKEPRFGPPQLLSIVDLPEFAPDFPTTAPLGGLFGALNTARGCREFKNAFRGGPFVLVSGKEFPNLAGALLVRWFCLSRECVVLWHRMATRGLFSRVAEQCGQRDPVRICS